MPTDEEALARFRDQQDRKEEAEVRELGDRIGYGRMMQLCSRVWTEKHGDSGAFSVGPCLSALVPCEGPQHEPSHPDHPHCDWCCGTMQVVKRVAEVIASNTWEPSENTEPKPETGEARSAWERLVDAD